MHYGHYYWFSPRHRIADEPIRQIITRQPGLLPVQRKLPEKTLQPQQGYDFRVAAGAGAWLVGITLASTAIGVVIQIQDRATEQFLFDEAMEVANRTISVGSGSGVVEGRTFLLPQPKLLAGPGVMHVSVRNQDSSARTVIGALELLEP